MQYIANRKWELSIAYYSLQLMRNKTYQKKSTKNGFLYSSNTTL